MTVRFVRVEDTHNGTDLDAIAHNNDVLAEGVRGFACTNADWPTIGQRLDYDQYLPIWLCACFIAYVEEYSNGALNFKVKARDSQEIVGYIIVRP